MSRPGRAARELISNIGWVANRVDHSGPVPPYLQLADILGSKILSGEFAPGQQLPSVERLQQEYGLARGTVRKAVRVLRDEGLVYVVTGWGTYVTEQQR